MTKVSVFCIILLSVAFSSCSQPTVQQVPAPKYEVYGDGLMNTTAAPSQVYVIGDYPNGNIIPVMAGTNTDNYAAIASPTQLGVPRDTNYIDNFFSGAEWGITPSANKDSWTVKGFSTHTNGPNSHSPTINPMSVRVMIIRIN